MKIYTRSGDRGQTGLIGGQRVDKTALRIAAIGDVDELNASLGLAAALGSKGLPLGALARVQRELFSLGAELASPDAKPRAQVQAEFMDKLEEEIDTMTAELPALTAFILPGGSQTGALLHVSRTVCRRAERAVLALHAAEPLAQEPLAYLNRLSDWLFTAARLANQAAGVQESEWHEGKSPADQTKRDKE